MSGLTKVQEYAVKYLYEIIKMNTKTISKELNISVTRLDKFLNIKKNKKIKTQTSSTENNDPELLITKTTNNRKGVSIMTPTASQKSDELYKNMPNVVSRTARNAIFRPRD